VSRALVEITRRPSRRARLEAIGLSVACRLMIKRLSFDRSMRILDALPKAEPNTTSVVQLPEEAAFRGAGACLARSMARSQFLRRRGVSSSILIGALGRDGVSFDAHAWLAPFDESQGHVVIHTVER
jgi:hypothetical protein